MLSAPHIVDLDAHGYWDCKVRLFIVGQETRGWMLRSDTDAFWESGETILEPLLNQYRQFHCGMDFYRSPFWAAARSLHDQLNPNSPGWAFVASNLFKVDEAERRPSHEVQEVLYERFNLLPAELRNAEPHVVVFFTGAPLGAILLRALTPFGEVKLQALPGYDLRVVARIVHPFLPLATFRTYHPNYLRRSRRAKVVDAIGAASLATV
jgi:hypothetical protein